MDFFQARTLIFDKLNDLGYKETMFCRKHSIPYSTLQRIKHSKKPCCPKRVAELLTILTHHDYTVKKHLQFVIHTE